VNDLINFSDILKKSVVETSFLGSFSINDIFSVILVTLIVSMFMFMIYKRSFSGNIYNHNFNVSLVLMALITSEIIMTISSNLVLSLGMVGALSIVRFRTAVKEPLDIVFMFWAIAIGITTGAKLYTLSIVSSLMIGLITVILLRYKNTNNVYLLILQYENLTNENLLKELSKLNYKIKSKTISMGLVELTLEIKLIGAKTTFIEELSAVEGVKNVSLVSYSGDFAQ
jgi:uncharacterized membrane protein YhiD involved in acid resistance